MMKILGIGKAREFSHDWGDELHLNYSTNIKVEQIIFSSFHESTTLHPPSLSFPVYYVVVDEASSSVIVSLRGTNSFSDLMTVRSFLVQN